MKEKITKCNEVAMFRYWWGNGPWKHACLIHAVVLRKAGEVIGYAFPIEPIDADPEVTCDSVDKEK